MDFVFASTHLLFGSSGLYWSTPSYSYFLKDALLLFSLFFAGNVSLLDPALPLKVYDPDCVPMKSCWTSLFAHVLPVLQDPASLVESPVFLSARTALPGPANQASLAVSPALLFASTKYQTPLGQLHHLCSCFPELHYKIQPALHFIPTSGTCSSANVLPVV